ncbi:MAG: DUF6512 family protein [Patescibacteria group bacterium]|jgi:hypothetical protein
MNKIKTWEIWGAIISIIVGSLLHFVFDWSGGNHFVALFAAVNESTWEHLKMAFWPTFIFNLIEYLSWGSKHKNFCFASLVKLFSMPIIIIALFYGWLALFPGNFIWDISIFVIAVIVGYTLSYKILSLEKTFGPNILWSLLIVAGLIKFSLFTYFPPKLFLFEDPDGNYGIVTETILLPDQNGCLNYQISNCPIDLCNKSCEPTVNSNASNCAIGKCVPKKL